MIEDEDGTQYLPGNWGRDCPAARTALFRGFCGNSAASIPAARLFAPRPNGTALSAFLRKNPSRSTVRALRRM